jgi:hypothetical protein
MQEFTENGCKPKVKSPLHGTSALEVVIPLLTMFRGRSLWNRFSRNEKLMALEAGS